MIQIAISILCICLGLSALLYGTAKLLKALGVKVKYKPAPMSEEEKELIKAATDREKTVQKGLDSMFSFGGGY